MASDEGLQSWTENNAWKEWVKLDHMRGVGSVWCAARGGGSFRWMITNQFPMDTSQ